MRNKCALIVLGLAMSLALPGVLVSGQQIEKHANHSVVITLDNQTPASQGSDTDPVRIATREKLQKVLELSGAKIKVKFTQSAKQPFNFVGMLNQGLTNADLMEIVVSVTPSATIGFRVYPHYKGGYLNLSKVKDPTEFMRQLLRMSDANFLFWGVDKTGDIFSGYTFTLESGFPAESIDVVVRSIANIDSFVGTLRPSVDGSTAPAPAKSEF